MRNLLAAMFSVAFAFVAVLGFGFWVHDRLPVVSDELFGALGAVLLFVVAGVVYCLLSGYRPTIFARRIPVPPVDTSGDAAWAASLVAYAENPDALATCAHLQVMERAMRQRGLKVRLTGLSEYYPMIETVCRINEHSLRVAFKLPESIIYRKWYEAERHPEDHPLAHIRCTECNCAIAVTHPDRWDKDTPWFP